MSVTGPKGKSSENVTFPTENGVMLVRSARAKALSSDGCGHCTELDPEHRTAFAPPIIILYIYMKNTCYIPERTICVGIIRSCTLDDWLGNCLPFCEKLCIGKSRP